MESCVACTRAPHAFGHMYPALSRQERGQWRGGSPGAAEGAEGSAMGALRLDLSDELLPAGVRFCCRSYQVASSWHPVLNRFDNILAAPCLAGIRMQFLSKMLSTVEVLPRVKRPNEHHSISDPNIQCLAGCIVAIPEFESLLAARSLLHVVTVGLCRPLPASSRRSSRRRARVRGMAEGESAVAGESGRELVCGCTGAAGLTRYCFPPPGAEGQAPKRSQK